MNNSNIYNKNNKFHPYLDFVGKLNTSCKENFCSCVLIDTDKVLSAKHCLKKCNPHNIEFINGEKSKIESIKTYDDRDLCLIILKNKIKNILPISIKTQIKSNLFLIAGYGIYENSSTLRWGISHLHMVSEHTITLKDKADLPILSFGDSGGRNIFNRKTKNISFWNNHKKISINWMLITK